MIVKHLVKTKTIRMPPSLSELTPIIFKKELTHIGWRPPHVNEKIPSNNLSYFDIMDAKHLHCLFKKSYFAK